MATISKSVAVVDGGTYTLELNAIPNGSTVTPVNDIQTWLHCADIWNKTYTTITQVLADGGTLQALIASNNSVDYMVRSTNWASSVVANSNAMTYIGANDYCANKLLANATWCDAICHSTYFELVLTTKVPTMTSNTTPSGVANSSYLYSTYYPWKAFNVNESRGWICNNNGSWISYEFPNPVMVKMVTGNTNTASGNDRSSFQYIEGSNDNNTWETLHDGTVLTPPGGGYATLPLNNTKYKYYRIRNVRYSDWDTYGGHKFQFYGRA